jgi:hypothetical protein
LAYVFHIVSSFVFINYFIIIIAFVCNKETVTQATFTTEIDRNHPPPPRATSQTHRQHLIKQQIWQIEKKKTEKKLGCGDRESTQTRDPPQAHATPPRRPTATRANPPKILENPLQTATVEIAKREGVRSLCSPRLAISVAITAA